jgi:hypothetical protein
VVALAAGEFGQGALPGLSLLPAGFPVWPGFAEKSGRFGFEARRSPCLVSLLMASVIPFALSTGALPVSRRSPGRRDILPRVAPSHADGGARRAEIRPTMPSSARRTAYSSALRDSIERPANMVSGADVPGCVIGTGAAGATLPGSVSSFTVYGAGLASPARSRMRAKVSRSMAPISPAVRSADSGWLPRINALCIVSSKPSARSLAARWRAAALAVSSPVHHVGGLYDRVRGMWVLTFPPRSGPSARCRPPGKISARAGRGEGAGGRCHGQTRPPACAHERKVSGRRRSLSRVRIIHYRS